MKIYQLETYKTGRCKSCKEDVCITKSYETTAEDSQKNANKANKAIGKLANHNCPKCGTTITRGFGIAPSDATIIIEA